MQHLSWAAVIRPPGSDRHDLLDLSNGGQIERAPSALLKQMPNEVIHMEPLHDHDNGVFDFAVESRQQSVGIPLLQTVPRNSEWAS